MRAAGALLVLLASFCFASAAARSLRDRIDELRELCGALELMRAELAARKTPLNELTELLAEQSRGETGAFFHDVGLGLASLDKREMQEIWADASRSHFGQLKEEREHLARLGRILGRYEINEQLEAIGETEERCRSKEKELSAAFPEQKRLIFGVSGACACLLAILLM